MVLSRALQQARSRHCTTCISGPLPLPFSPSSPSRDGGTPPCPSWQRTNKHRIPDGCTINRRVVCTSAHGGRRPAASPSGRQVAGASEPVALDTAGRRRRRLYHSVCLLNSATASVPVPRVGACAATEAGVAPFAGGAAECLRAAGGVRVSDGVRRCPRERGECGPAGEGPVRACSRPGGRVGRAGRGARLPTPPAQSGHRAGCRAARLSSVNCSLSSVNCSLSPSAVRCPVTAVHCPPSDVQNQLSTLHSLCQLPSVQTRSSHLFTISCSLPTD